ncbi:hypothetical protein [Pseudomonas huaxiensis]|uniref:hypothetical protein n=1 Tax=Pseudomonas huaxiensis TaxID=2213017 RepID=UPI000DA683DA|nr:hypothetical protein [Pseudomonas huaxiensis]
MRYNTGNPVGPDGSSDPRDLFDNAGNIDIAANSRTQISYPDRLGVQRKTLWGMEQQVNDFLANSGYEPTPLNYVDGAALVVNRPTQLIQREDSIYSVKLPAAFPVTLTGTWSIDQDRMVAQVDRSLRQDLADPFKGVSLVGFKAVGASAASRSLARRYEIDAKSRVNVIDYMTEAMIADVLAGTRLVDTYPAYAAAQNALPLQGGVLIAPAGTSRLDSMLTLKHGVSMQGTGYMYSVDGLAPANTVLVPNHTGKACISLVGSNGCRLSNLAIKSYPGTFPKCGLLLGRDTTASSGHHLIEFVFIIGYFSAAPVYSIASEVNLLSQLYIWLQGGGATKCYVSGVSDTLGVGGLVTSSNLDNTFIKPYFLNDVIDPNAACMYLECGQQMGSFKVVGGYMIASSGSYIHMSLGVVESFSPLGPFMFDCNGERMAGGDPIYGIRITATGTHTLKGLAVSGARFDFLASDLKTHYDINVPANVILDHPNIVMPPPEAFPYATSQVTRALVRGGVLVVGRVDRWTPLDFGADGWSDEFGPPHAAAGWRVNSDSRLFLRGTLQGPSAGTFATLPAGYYPPYDMYFPVSCGSTPTVGRVFISSVNGRMSYEGTQTIHVDLSAISFNLTA